MNNPRIIHYEIVLHIPGEARLSPYKSEIAFLNEHPELLEDWELFPPYERHYWEDQTPL